VLASVSSVLKWPNNVKKIATAFASEKLLHQDDDTEIMAGWKQIFALAEQY